MPKLTAALRRWQGVLAYVIVVVALLGTVTLIRVDSRRQDERICQAIIEGRSVIADLVVSATAPSGEPKRDARAGAFRRDALRRLSEATELCPGVEAVPLEVSWTLLV